MAEEKVDPKKDIHVLVVHGVQASTDDKLKQDVWIRDMMIRNLNGAPINFDVSLFKYENINNANQTQFINCMNMVTSALTSQISIWGVPSAVNWGISKVGSLVDDVLIAVDREGATAQLIKNNLKAAIVNLFNQGRPVYLVAHSLGTIYAYWALSELLRDPRYFDPKSKRSWPVQAFFTLGSPLVLKMFGAKACLPFTGASFPSPFIWYNFYDLADPIITGSAFGILDYNFVGVERFIADGFFIDDLKIDTGKAWLFAHTAYWKNEIVGQALTNMVLQDRMGII